MKKGKINKMSLIIEFAVWGILIVFGMVGLILNFIKGNIVGGVVYSLIAGLSLGGLLFNVIYIVRRLGDDEHLPKD